MPVYNYEEYCYLIRDLPSFVRRDIYNIPCIEKEPIDISHLNNGQWLINLNNISKKDKLAPHKIVHSFSYDDVLNRHYNHPFNFLEKTANYLAISSFDFSMHSNMNFPQILNAVYKNRWIGAFAQSNGRPAIATVGWTTEEYDSICFAGLTNGSIFIISTLGANNEYSKPEFLRGYLALRGNFPSSEIICVGDRIDGIDSDVCYIKYEESFGNWNYYQKEWQPSLFNWNGSISLGGK